MAEFDKHESAKWTLATDQVAREYEEARDKVLVGDASRGFPTVTGESLSELLDVGMKAKLKLTEINGKLYEEERGRQLEIREFEMKMAVAVAKLAMQFYREQLMNEIMVETVQVEARADYYRGDIERMNAVTESRQVAIINAKAQAEHEVNGYRLQLIEAERSTLGVDIQLLNAQLATANARLAIIDSIYEVIAAQALVIAAENRKAAALVEVLAAETEVAAIKQAMIPGYMQKAAAKIELAAATTEDAANRKAIETLGFQRNALKAAEAESESGIRQAELAYALLQEALVRATDAVEVTRAQSRAAVETAHTAARQQSIAIRQGAEITRGSTRWQAELTQVMNRVAASIYQSDGHAAIIEAALNDLIAHINAIAISEEGSVKASAYEHLELHTESAYEKHIIKGN